MNRNSPILFNVDDSIEEFSVSHYNARDYAQSFFARHAESEATRKLNELSSLQNHVESILRKKVKQNYLLFLEASKGISTVGNDMQSLKELVVKTQKLVEVILKNRAHDKALKAANSIVNLRLQQRLNVDEESQLEKNLNSSANDLSSVPVWVLKAPEDLHRFIIEQSFTQAVDLIHNIRSYLESVKTALDSSIKSPLADLLKKLDDREHQLGNALLASTSRLPNSQLWGAAEQLSRLRLLVSLRLYISAAEGFVLSHGGVISRVIRNVEVSGEALEYVSEISQSFFMTVNGLCVSFLDLFAKEAGQTVGNGKLTSFVETVVALCANLKKESKFSDLLKSTNTSSDADPGLTAANLFVSWVLKQVEIFAVALARQMKLTLTTKSSDFIESMRSIPTALSVRELKDIESSKEVTGPLTFVSTCIGIAYRDASILFDRNMNLNCGSTLIWLLQGDIMQYVNSFAEDYLKELQFQFNQEQWQLMNGVPLGILTPDIRPRLVSDYMGSSSIARGDGVCQIYLWVIIALSRYAEDARALLSNDVNAGSRNSVSFVRLREISMPSGDSKGFSDVAYSRAHLSEIEPVIASSFLRMLLTFVRLLCGVDSSVLNGIQLACYHSTLEKVGSVMLPSALTVMDALFTPKLKIAPKGTIDILTAKVLERLSKEKTASVPKFNLKRS